MAVVQPNTESIYSELLAERASEEKFDPSEIRLSEAGSCGRKQTLRALGYKPAEADERALSIFQSGDEHEDAIYHLWAARYPRRVRRQMQVVTPYGTGHIDIWASNLRHIVESKSTTEKNRHRLPMDSHVAQVQMYLHFWGNKRNATVEIAYRIKETGQIVSIPVQYDPELAELLIRNLQSIQGAIFAREPLPIPEGYGPVAFPCSWYANGEVKRCPFWEYCYGAEATHEESGKVIAAVPALKEDLERYVRIAERKTSLNREIKAVDEQKRALEKLFEKAAADAHADAIAAGSIQIRRSYVPGKRTLSNPSRLVEDGVLTQDELNHYLSTSSGYYRWTKVKKGAK